MARDSTARWRAGAPLSPLDGVPTTIKDIAWVKGPPMRYGSRTTLEAPCSTDAPSVKRLRAGGAVFLGITAAPEFGWKGVTDSPLTGLTRNPWDREMTPGGSSGGAVVAAATGAGALHIGADGGGSIRIPLFFHGRHGTEADLRARRRLSCERFRDARPYRPDRPERTRRRCDAQGHGGARSQRLEPGGRRSGADRS
jgi:Asp-tRNA(Asn)/Glu-tRNA(Gln) amidotransferase A subunit family amidase